MILLFTGGGGAGNQAIYRILRKKYNIYFADAKHTSFSPDIPISRCYKTPFATERRLGTLCSLGALRMFREKKHNLSSFRGRIMQHVYKMHPHFESGKFSKMPNQPISCNWGFLIGGTL